MQNVEVEAGVRRMDLNETLAPAGLFFPMDPGPGASIGGMIGTCCSGTNAVKYGVMRDWILSLTVVLADGRIVQIGKFKKGTKSRIFFKTVWIFSSFSVQGLGHGKIVLDMICAIYLSAQKEH